MDGPGEWLRRRPRASTGPPRADAPLRAAQGGLTSAQKQDLLRIAMRLAGRAQAQPRCHPLTPPPPRRPRSHEPCVRSNLRAGDSAALLDALLPEALRPGKKDRALSLERCVSVMLGGVVPQDKVALLVNKRDADGRLTQNAWQARAGAGAGGGGVGRLEASATALPSLPPA